MYILYTNIKCNIKDVYKMLKERTAVNTMCKKVTRMIHVSVEDNRYKRTRRNPPQRYSSTYLPPGWYLGRNVYISVWDQSDPGESKLPLGDFSAIYQKDREIKNDNTLYNCNKCHDKNPVMFQTDLNCIYSRDRNSLKKPPRHGSFYQKEKGKKGKRKKQRISLPGTTRGAWQNSLMFLLK